MKTKILLLLLICVMNLKANNFYNIEITSLNGEKLSSFLIDEKGKKGPVQNSKEEVDYSIVKEFSVDKDVKDSICLKQKVIFFLGGKPLTILLSKKSFKIGKSKHEFLVDIQQDAKTKEWNFIHEEVSIKLQLVSSSGEILKE